MPAATCPYVSAPDTIEERIRDDIVTTLQSVTTGNGWRQTLSVVGRKQRGDYTIVNNLCIVYADDPTPVEQASYIDHELEQDFAICFYKVQDETGTTDIDELIANTAGDIQSALCQITTHQRGGLALRTMPKGRIGFQEESGEFAGCIVVVTVQYGTRWGDPTASSY